MPTVVRVLNVIKSDVDKLDLHLGITVDGDFVIVVREVVQCARGVSKKIVNQALAGNASENLACVFGIAGCIFDTACWIGSINVQATCEVKHIAQVLDWSLGNYQQIKDIIIISANGLTVDKSIALVEDVGDKLVPHMQQLISGGRGRMAALMGLDIEQVDQDLVVLRAKNERAKVAMTQLQQTHTELGAVWKEADLGLAALTAVKKDLDCKGHTCKTLEAEVKELLGEPQASTRGLTGV